MKKFVLIFALFACCQTLAGQPENFMELIDEPTFMSVSMMEDLGLPDIIPPSPNAASLGMFGDVPVSHNTGIPNISIPIYEIQQGNISVPINLSYHSSGNKVSQEASWVGLGWALQAGGLISRTVNGLDDFSVNNGVNSNMGWINSPSLPHHIDDLVPIVDGTAGSEKLQDYFKGLEDPQPDIFSFNFAGYSGKFVYPKHPNPGLSSGITEPLLIAGDNLKIEYTGYKQQYTLVDIGKRGMAPGEFKITTPDGSKYYFTHPEITRYYQDPSPNPVNISSTQPFTTNSWYLTKIENYWGDKVEFEYETYSKIKSHPYGHYDTGRANDSYGINHTYESYSFSQTVTDEVLLRKIKFRGGYVLFESIAREDLMYEGNKVPQALSSIKVYNSGDQLIKRFDFTFDYFNKAVAGYLSKRLKLDKVIENNEKIWQFEYNPLQLPAKNSIQVDHWGYYNGATIQGNNFGIRNNIPVPLWIDSSWQVSGRTPHIDLGIVREPDENRAQASVLKKIIYPTGGYTEFEYELHEFDNSDFSYRGSDYKYKPHFDKWGISESMVWDTDFFFRKDEVFHLTLSVSSPAFSCPSSSSSSQDPVLIDWSIAFDFRPEDSYFEIYKLDNSGRETRIMRETFDMLKCMNLVGREHTITSTALGNYITEDGNYRFRLMSYYDTKCNWSLIRFSPRQKDEMRGAGLRIKEIRNFDGSQISKKVFEYQINPPTSGVRGICYAYPRYSIAGTGPFGSDMSWHKFSSSVLPSGCGFTGAAVAYPFVREKYYLGDECVSWKEYTFQNEYPNLTSHTPGMPGEIFVNNGLPRQYVEYENGNKKVIGTLYDYREEESISTYVEGVKVYPFNLSNVRQVNGYFSFYKVPSQWWYLHNVVEQYSQKLYEKTEYEYNTTYKQPRSLKRTLADGSVYTEQYKYPYDLTSESMYLPILNANRHNLLVEKTVNLNNRFLYSIRDEQLLTLSEWNKRIVRSRENSAAETRVVREHDSYRNPIYIVKDDVEKVVYLWGYEGLYPVAEIRNASIEEVDQILGSSVNSSPSYEPGRYPTGAFSSFASTKTPNMTILNSLRQRLPNAHVTTLLYKPLVGVTQITDPSGVSYYYEYDSSGRLSNVKDDKGNPVEKYEYNFEM